MASTMKIPTEFTAIDKFSSVVAKMTSGVGKFTKSTSAAVSRVNTKINGLFSSMDNLSQLALGAGFAGLFVAAGSAVMDYETALHSLEAVTGESSGKFKSQIEKIAISSNKSAIDVAKSFEIIGSAMSQYLSDPKSLGQISEAGIMLSKAAKMEMEPALESLTSAMNQFNLGADMAFDTVNRLTAGEIVGSVSTSKATEQLSKFGAVANSLNVSLPESVALIQTLGKKFTGSMQSEIGTAAKNMLLIMDSSSAASKAASVSLARNGVDTRILMNHTIPLSARLKELSKIQNDATAKAFVFGKENATAGAVIFDQLGTYIKWEEQIRKTNKAQEQARVNSDTLAKGIEAIKNSFINAIVSGDKLSSSLELVKSVAFFIAKNMKTIISVVAGVVAVFGTFKLIVGILEIASAAQAAYTFVVAAYSAVAVTAALTGASFAAVVWATLAPILAVIAAIAAIIAIFYYWDEIVAWFSKQWGAFTTFISEFDFVGMFKSIGQSIIDFMLFPLKAVLSLVAMIPGGIGEAAQMGLDKLNKMTDLGVNVNSDIKKLDSPEQVNAKNMQENRLSGGLDVNIRDKGNNVESASPFGNFGIPVKVTQTQGAF
jgi:TP901 family phage tail tape measure protein